MVACALQGRSRSFSMVTRKDSSSKSGVYLLGEFFQQDLEGALGHVELVALLLQALDLVDDFLAVKAVCAQIQPQLAGLVGHVAFAGKIRNQHTPLVADFFGRHVLVGAGGLHDGADVDPALVGECAFAHEGAAVEGRHVGGFAHEAGELAYFFQVGGAHAGDVELGAQDRHDGCQVRVAAALTVAVDRAVDHDRPGPDRGDAVGHCQPAVVVGVNPQPGRGAGGPLPGQVLLKRGDCRFDFKGQAAAVGVTEHDKGRAGMAGGGYRLQGIGLVGLEAVEKMLGVVNHLASPGLEIGHRFRIMARFSSRVLSMIRVTCRSQLLPKIVTVWQSLSSSAFGWGPGRQGCRVCGWRRKRRFWHF